MKAEQKEENELLEIWKGTSFRFVNTEIPFYSLHFLVPKCFWQLKHKYDALQKLVFSINDEYQKNIAFYFYNIGIISQADDGRTFQMEWELWRTSIKEKQRKELRGEED